jgi:hypothetical protein
MPLTVKVNGAMNGLVHKGSNHIANSTAPDVCKTPSPGGPVPVPYPVIVSQSGDLANGTTTVKVDGQMAAVKDCEFSMCTGDEPGTAGGVVSSTFKKEAKFILFSFDVKLDGKNACRFSDKMTMNHQNTVCMAGVFPTVVQAEEVQELLAKIADECNRDENTKAGHCPNGPAPTGDQCRTLGTKKHKCCEKKLKERAAKDPPPKPVIQSEVPYSSPGVPASAASEEAARSAAGQAYNDFITANAPGGGAAAISAAKLAARTAKVWANAYFGGGGAPFRADVLVGSPPTKGYDFKFNCTKDVTISAKQRLNYFQYAGVSVEKVHVDGRSC